MWPGAQTAPNGLSRGAQCPRDRTRAAPAAFFVPSWNPAKKAPVLPGHPPFPGNANLLIGTLFRRPIGRLAFPGKSLPFFNDIPAFGRGCCPWGKSRGRAGNVDAPFWRVLRVSEKPPRTRQDGASTLRAVSQTASLAGAQRLRQSRSRDGLGPTMSYPAIRGRGSGWTLPAPGSHNTAAVPRRNFPERAVLEGAG